MSNFHLGKCAHRSLCILIGRVYSSHELRYLNTRNIICRICKMKLISVGAGNVYCIAIYEAGCYDLPTLVFEYCKKNVFHIIFIVKLSMIISKCSMSDHLILCGIYSNLFSRDNRSKPSGISMSCATKWHSGDASLLTQWDAILLFTIEYQALALHFLSKW